MNNRLLRWCAAGLVLSIFGFIGVILQAEIRTKEPPQPEFRGFPNSANFRNPNRVHEISQRVLVDLEQVSEEKEPLPNMKHCPRWLSLALEYKKCLVWKLNTEKFDKLWLFLPQAVQMCGGELLRHILRAKYLVNSDDIKLVVLPRNEQETCTSITVGIGNDTSAEKQLQLYLPNTKFHGADPFRESGKAFEKYGKFYETGISAKGGPLNASVLLSGNYTHQTIPTKPLYKFINETLKLQTVDVLFMDVEGAEYDILPQFNLNGPFSNITICQMNIEIHGPLKNYNVTELLFARRIRRFFNRSPFLPLWVPKPLNHQRVFLVNWKNDYCIEKFFKDWC